MVLPSTTLLRLQGWIQIYTTLLQTNLQARLESASIGVVPTNLTRKYLSVDRRHPKGRTTVKIRSSEYGTTVVKSCLLCRHCPQPTPARPLVPASLRLTRLYIACNLSYLLRMFGPTQWDRWDTVGKQDTQVTLVEIGIGQKCPT